MYKKWILFAAIKINNNISAVAIAERLNPDTLVIRILKADPNITGLYQTIMNEFLSRQSKSFDYVNLEEDLGIAGLRKSKLSYHPIEMIQKYTLSLKK